MKLRFTRRAAEDLADIADYIRKQNPQAALRVRAAILSTLPRCLPHAAIRSKVSLPPSLSRASSEH